MRHWLVAAALPLLMARGALAHMAPAHDANNRYLKLSPLADGVRLAYTIYFGELPGRRMRAEIDRDRDGDISDEEARLWSAKLAQEVAAGIELRVDDQTSPIEWRAVDVGLGAPVADGGSFAVDFIAWRCAPSGTNHRVELYDRVNLPHQGETELRVEATAGITTTRIALGANVIEAHATVPKRAVSEAWVVMFTAAPDAQRAACAAPAVSTSAGSSSGARLALVAVAAGALALVGVVLALRARRRRAR